MKYLFRVSLTASDGWSKYYGKKLKPVYVVESNKERAEFYAQKQLQEGLKIKNLMCLGAQLGNNFFSGNTK